MQSTSTWAGFGNPAVPGRQTLALTCCRKRERSGRCQASAAAG